jgi:hypothetical protein
MGYQPGGEIMASLLPVVTHVQKLSYKCQVYDKYEKIIITTKNPIILQWNMSKPNLLGSTFVLKKDRYSVYTD